MLFTSSTIFYRKNRYMQTISQLDSYLLVLNNNNYFIGIMMILLNIGTKYLMQEFGQVIDFVFNIKFIRRIMLFTVFFVATRDIKVSIILTGFFIIFAMELLNEKSKNCILPNKWLEKFKNNGNDEKKITQVDIAQAIKTLKKAGLM